MLACNYPLLVFSNTYVEYSASQKLLVLILGSRLNFQEHLDIIFKTLIKMLGLIQKFENLLSRPVLITLFKSLIRPDLDCRDVTCDKANNSIFHMKLEPIQLNAALAINGATRGNFKERTYRELNLETV